MSIHAGLAAATLSAVLAVGCSDPHPFHYDWDDRRVLCSSTLDDLLCDLPWDRIEDRLETAREQGSVEHAQLAELAAAGHGIEAHGVHHLDGVVYAREHGAAAYVADEVLPSIQVLEAAGYPVTSFAFPSGTSSRELEALSLAHVARVRVGPGTCPW
jgi:hypothetical protein